ncbi:NADH dehydrogenase [Amycolatopsis arida]|uniref:NADH dehydrogenase n=1 Tax=Amycolatopsis arida TaxID=587909 RepID=A0A1I5L499_9PSEU|nr:NAD(P)/FAD-dependent oxidoreductase [Amycolatopsis arida]TDX93579.1 NADH dehydrogenase [Amycolatopsis arida]SFO92149.1 NADH dehydrogenase [Amycolatopsis arida]
MPHEPTRIVVIGGGHVGLTAATRLRRALTADEATITVVDARSYMTYQPFLAEAAAGSVEPRHVVVPLREVLPGCDVTTAEVTGIDSAARTITLQVAGGDVRRLGYDLLVVAPGSVSKIIPIPGVAEHAIGFKTLEEAIYLRNHVLSRLDAAASTDDPELRGKLLTFVFVGGGYAGVEALAELEDATRQAAAFYAGIDPDDTRFVLVEAMSRIMPEVSAPLAQYTLDRLTERGIRVHLDTTLKSAENCHMVLSDGTEYDADTLVWTAGVKANPMLAETDLPLDERGRVKCDATLRVEGVPDVFAAGDCAAVPDLTSADPNATCAPSAQHATRQAKQLVRNIVATLRGGRLGKYKHRYAGSVASLGLYRGVAEIYGVKIKGAPAWVLHRTYHLAKLPTLHHKARVAADWALSLPFPRQVVATGQQHEPRRAFARAGGERG